MEELIKHEINDLKNNSILLKNLFNHPHTLQLNV